MKELAIYIKPTNYCNVDCDHCYLPQSVRDNKETISTDKLKGVYEFCVSVAKKEGFDSIMLIWHGGEPMMLSPEWYEEAHKIADDVIGKGKYISTIQTSLLPYNSKWNEVIKNRFGNFVGTSVDFSAREFRGSNEKYLDTFMKRIELLKSNNIDFIPSFVPATSEIDSAAEITNWFIKNGFNYFNFERYTNVENKKDINYPSNIMHSNFMIDMFDRLMELQKLGVKAPIVKPIVAAILGVEYRQPGDRWGTSCQSSFIVVEPNGNLNTCPDRAVNEKPFSNISSGADAFIKSKGRRFWIRESVLGHKEDHCAVCEYRTWCKSGCPINPNNPKDRFQQDCSGYKKFLNHVKKYLNSENKNIALEYTTNEWN